MSSHLNSSACALRAADRGLPAGIHFLGTELAHLWGTDSSTLRQIGSLVNTASQIMHRFGATVLRVVLVVLLALFGVLIAGAVSAQTVTEATRALGVADASVGEETERFEELLGRYERELATVNALRSGGVLNAFSQTTLRDALRQANSSADTLAMADAVRLDAVARREVAGVALAAALQAEMDQIEAQLLSRMNAASLAAAVGQLNALSSRLAELAQRAADEPIEVAISEILADLPETAEEMLAAADELADHAVRLETDLAYWSGEAARYETRRRIQQRNAEYRVQDDLFGDGTARPTARTSQGAATGGDSNPVEDEVTSSGAERVSDVPSQESTAVASSPGLDQEASPGESDSSDDSESHSPTNDFSESPETGGGLSAGGEGADPDNTPALTNPGRVIRFEPIGGSAEIVAGRDASDPTVRAIGSLDPSEVEQDSGPELADPRRRRDAIVAELEAVRAEQERLLRSASALQE